MKAVIVLGFHDQVYVHLQREYSALLQGTLVWVGAIQEHGDGDIRNFKSFLFDKLENGFTEILVLAVIRRGTEETYGQEVADLVSGAARRFPAAQIDLEPFKYAGASSEVGSRVSTFLNLQPQSADAIPESLDGLENWCLADNLRDRLLVLPRAIGAAKDSQFEDISLVYKSLSLLANEYWELRVNGGLDKRQRWHAGLEGIGLTVAPSISKSRAKEQGDNYFVNYPVGSPPGNTKFLDQHLKKGADRDERFCFRLYFFWDAKKNIVVVGWLPSHLDTRAT